MVEFVSYSKTVFTSYCACVAWTFHESQSWSLTWLHQAAWDESGQPVQQDTSGTGRLGLRTDGFGLSLCAVCVAGSNPFMLAKHAEGYLASTASRASNTASHRPGRLVLQRKVMQEGHGALIQQQ